MANAYESVLMASPLFAGFTEYGAQSVLASGEIMTLSGGELLFEEGGPPDWVAFLLEGELEAFVEREGADVTLGSMAPGALIGELAVLCGEPRAASVRAAGQAAILKWGADGFRRLLLSNPQLSRRVFSEALKLVLENQKALISEVVRSRSA